MTNNKWKWSICFSLFCSFGRLTMYKRAAQTHLKLLLFNSFNQKEKRYKQHSNSYISRTFHAMSGVFSKVFSEPNLLLFGMVKNEIRLTFSYGCNRLISKTIWLFHVSNCNFLQWSSDIIDILRNCDDQNSLYSF